MRPEVQIKYKDFKKIAVLILFIKNFLPYFYFKALKSWSANSLYLFTTSSAFPFNSSKIFLNDKI
jgi:hypothetical protein